VRWLLIAPLGVILWSFVLLLARLQSGSLQSLIYERGWVQFITLLFGALILAFCLLKAYRLTTEIRLSSSRDTPQNLIPQDIDEAIMGLMSRRSLLARRTLRLLTVWQQTGSAQKVQQLADEEVDAFDLAMASSYSLPKILIWALPVLGFIGTVVGLGEAVGGFETFLDKADDVELLKQGLVQVTSGLGSAFDTTYLALLVAVLTMLPLSILERLESRVLTDHDLRIRRNVLFWLPDTLVSESGGINPGAIRQEISQALHQYSTTNQALLQSARETDEQLSRTLTELLQPLAKLPEHLDPLQGFPEKFESGILELQQELRSQSRLIGQLPTNLSSLMVVRSSQSGETSGTSPELESMISANLSGLGNLTESLDRSLERLSGELLSQSRLIGAAAERIAGHLEGNQTELMQLREGISSQTNELYQDAASTRTAIVEGLRALDMSMEPLRSICLTQAEQQKQLLETLTSIKHDSSQIQGSNQQLSLLIAGLDELGQLHKKLVSTLGQNNSNEQTAVMLSQLSETLKSLEASLQALTRPRRLVITETQSDG
jgi:biopolymer transport protein ExbB/TolQ